MGARVWRWDGMGGWGKAVRCDGWCVWDGEDASVVGMWWVCGGYVVGMDEMLRRSEGG
jgi:hypothetical protein